MPNQNIFDSKDFQKLETLRGEIVVQAHLMSAEVKERFHKIEANWRKLNSQLSHIRSAASSAKDEVTTATQLLADTIQEEYQKLKSSLH